MLRTRFPRPPGDIGNPVSFDHRVIYATVETANVPAIVNTHIDQNVIDDFIAAGETLVAQGADLLATSCGFVCAIHDRLQACLPVPLVSSALNLIPLLVSRHASQGPVGVMTFDASILSEIHFGRFWCEGLVVQGLEASAEFYPVIRFDRQSWCQERVEGEILAAGGALKQRYPELSALLLECTNLSPYRRQLAACLQVPVYDIHDAIAWRRRQGPL